MSFNDYIYWQTLQETGKTPEEIYEYNHPKVVRCKECNMCDEEMWCSFFDSIMESDDYCSYGERKESE